MARKAKSTLPAKEIRDRIVQALRIGSTRVVAAKFAGIPYAQLRRIIERGARGEARFVAFLAELTQAEAQAEVGSLATLERAAKAGDWRAAAAKLDARRAEPEEEPPDRDAKDPAAQDEADWYADQLRILDAHIKRARGYQAAQLIRRAMQLRAKLDDLRRAKSPEKLTGEALVAQLEDDFANMPEDLLELAVIEYCRRTGTQVIAVHDGGKASG